MKNDFIVNGEAPSNPVHSRDGLKYEGLTKREHFAGLAMQGYISSDEEDIHSPEWFASWAVQCADALLKELEK